MAEAIVVTAADAEVAETTPTKIKASKAALYPVFIFNHPIFLAHFRAW